MYSTLWRLLHFIFLLFTFNFSIEDFRDNIFKDLHIYFRVSPIIEVYFTIPCPIHTSIPNTHNTVSGENFITLKNQQFLLIYMRAIWVFSWGLDIPRCKWWPSWDTHWVFICLCAYLYMSVCVCIFLRVCLCICVCMCVWLAQM